MTNLAKVHCWNHLVGALAYDPREKTSVFEYAPEWIARGVELAPLHMPLSRHKFQFSQLSFETYKGLPAVFADTLPDDFGNAVINAWLARNGRDIQSFSALERLLYSGPRGMGAVEFAPAILNAETKNEQLELSSLVEMAQQVLDQRANLMTGIAPIEGNNEAMSALFRVGTSAGGARAKALIAVNQDRTQLRSGQVDAPEGLNIIC